MAMQTKNGIVMIIEGCVRNLIYSLANHCSHLKSWTSVNSADSTGAILRLYLGPDSIRTGKNLLLSR